MQKFEIKTSRKKKDSKFIKVSSNKISYFWGQNCRIIFISFIFLSRRKSFKI